MTMEVTHACPSHELLADWFDGKVPEPELTVILSHLEECTQCQDRASTLSSSDTLVESLRDANTQVDGIAEAAPRFLIDQLKQISTSRAVAINEPKTDFLTPPQQVGELGRFGRYRVLNVLGHGGMGIVFRAEDPQLCRLVALKVMLPRWASEPTAKDRFLREARAAAKLQSDHIVTIYEVGEENGLPYLAMELLTGRSLEQALHDENRLPRTQAVEVARQVARGLADAHAAGLIHRDIKPANLWLQSMSHGQWRVKILDFGLVCAIGDESRMTHHGAIVGTPAFMAPEQARGDNDIDQRADLFSLGCVLYLLCTGQLPFSAATTVGTLVAIVTQKPVSPRRLDPSLPLALVQLIEQLLEKDRTRRPLTAQQVLTRLQDLEQGTPLAGPHLRPDWLRLSLLLALVGILCAVVLAWRWRGDLASATQPDQPAIRAGTLAAGDAKVSTVSQALPATVEQEERDVDRDVDREVALWATSIGGEVRLPDVWAKTPQELPQSEFELTYLILADIASLSDNDLARLKHLKHLQHLNLAHTPISDRGLVHLSQLTTLNWLDLSDTKITNNGLEQLRELRNLTTLYLDTTPVSDVGIDHLLVHTQLETLALGKTVITDQGVLKLKGFPRLQELSLFGTQVTDEGLAVVEHLQALRNLNVCYTPITDRSLTNIASLSHLTHLFLGAPGVTDANLHPLKNLKNLRLLEIDGSKVTRDGLVELHAALPDCNFSNKGERLFPAEPSR